MELDIEVEEATEAIGYCGGVGVPHGGIADDADIGA